MAARAKTQQMTVRSNNGTNEETGAGPKTAAAAGCRTKNGGRTKNWLIKQKVAETAAVVAVAETAAVVAASGDGGG